MEDSYLYNLSSTHIDAKNQSNGSLKRSRKIGNRKTTMLTPLKTIEGYLLSKD